MRQCPYCKAEIGDNARFCLYCMKPLSEKEVILPPQNRKHLWFAIAAGVALLLFAVILVLVFIGGREEKPAASISANTTTAQTTDTTANTSTGGTEETTTQKTDDTTAPVQKPENTQPPEETTVGEEQPPEQTPTKPQTPTAPTQTQPPVQITPPTTTPTAPTQVEKPTTAPEEPTQAEIPTTTPEETIAPETPKKAVYTYRTARAGDDFNAHYTNSGNDIVITGIAQQCTDGTYDIPSYIDGKKVIAIVANAFSGSNAKVVYIPATVKTIWNYAFAGCSLTDIYFRGSAIYVESKAFSSGLTIHCSATCSDRNFRYYKNSAANYGATWTEWNG